MTSLFARFLLVSVSSVLLAGCNTAPKQNLVSPDQVHDETWVLIVLNGQPPVDGARVTLDFNPAMSGQGRVRGRAPCNGYFGGYTFVDNNLAFTPLGSTRMSCLPDFMVQEREFLTSIEATDRMTLNQGVLALSNSEGDEKLLFVGETAMIKGQVAPVSGEFPAGSDVIVKLQDEDRQGGVGLVGVERIKIGETSKDPIGFTLNYAPQLIKPKGRYVIFVQVLQTGRLIYTTKYPKITNLISVPISDVKKH